MKIFIERLGSGCGGVVGTYLIDTSSRTLINANKCWKEHNHSCDMRCFNCSKHKPSSAISDFNYDLSLLRLLLTCELVEPYSACMDQQIDRVYVSKDGKDWRRVYDTSYPDIYPANDALLAKLSRLFGVL